MFKVSSLKKNIFLSITIIIGLFYAMMSTVHIGGVALKSDSGEKKITLPFEGHSKIKDEQFIYVFSIDSKINQNKKIHITADDEISALHVNGENVSFEGIKQLYKQKVLKDYKRGYDFILPLKKGKNSVQVKTKNYGTGGYTFKLAQNFFYSDYIIFFLLTVIPFIILFIDLLHRYMNRIKEIFQNIFRKISELTADNSKQYLIYLPFAIIFLGIVFRLLYFAVYGYSSYQHDHYYHIEFIKYFAENWTLPLPDKALEFPQQPLYYFLTGKFFAILDYFGMPEKNILMMIASLSTAMMSATLIIAYATIKQITKSAFILNTSLGFLAFTPSFVFLSAQINNDPLNYFLAALALYNIVLYHNTNRGKHFAYALIFSALVFLTKVSSGMISIILFIVLLRKYFVEIQNSADKDLVLLHVKLFAIVILFFLGLSFLRVYLPSTGEFLFVNSGVFKGQEIKSLDFSYFMSFRIIDLINEGQSYVYDKHFMPVKQSFFTWQYATMLLGEYDFKTVMESLVLNKMVYFFSLIYVVGLGAFLYYFKKIPLIIKIFFPIVVINQLLIANFAFSFPSVCNTDFRYNSPAILLWAIVLGSGLYQLYSNVERLRNFVLYSIVMANIVQIIWLINLLILAKKNTIT